MSERLVSLASGGGTTFEKNVLATRDGFIPGFEVGGLIAGGPDIGAIKRASDLDIPWIVIDRKTFIGRNGEIDEDGFAMALDKAVRDFGGTVVSQNGWLEKTPEEFINSWKDVIFNQHPGPKWETRATKGKQPHAIMLDFARLTGRNEGTDVIIHRVDKDWDHGETVGIRHVPIKENDTAQVLQDRALVDEYILQIEHWNRFIRGEVVAFEEHTYLRAGEEKLLREVRKKARNDFPEG